MTEARSHCRNCGAPLLGEYCTDCGQPEGRDDLSFGAVAAEVVGEVFSWDSRIWRTLVPLVFRPGFLSAEYFAGRRARYVPPFRLYLILSFLLFLTLSWTIDTDLDVYVGEIPAAAPEAGLSIEESRGAPEGSEGTRPAEGGEGSATDSSAAEEVSAGWRAELRQHLERNAQKLSDNPADFLQLLVEYLPQMMFLLLPVFALLLSLCYFSSPFHYLQHLVFSLYFHCFVYLVYLLSILVKVFVYERGIGAVVLLLFALYLPAALVRSYDSRWSGAVYRSLFILLAEAILLVLSFSALSLLALALM